MCEYWDKERQRWVLVDAQLDDLQQVKLRIAFNPLDVPREAFVVAGHAWQMCRRGEADPDTFGIFDLRGLWFVWGNLVRDIAALKVELLPWDTWRLTQGQDEHLSGEGWRSLDQMAAWSALPHSDWERLREHYEHDPRWKVPPRIHRYTEFGLEEVALVV